PAVTLAWHPTGVFLALGCSDHNIYIWDTVVGKIRGVLTGHEGRVTGVSFDRDGDLLASSSWDSNMRLWDFRTGRQLVSMAGRGGFSSDGLHLVSGNGLQTVALLDLAAGHECRLLHTEAEP